MLSSIFKIFFGRTKDNTMSSVLLSLGCMTKVPLCGVTLKQETFMSHCSRVWEVQDQGPGWFGVWWGLLPGSQMALFRVLTRWRAERSKLSGLVRAPTLFMRAVPSCPHLFLITSQGFTSSCRHIGEHAFNMWLLMVYKYPVQNTQ